jgi:hypothetical protein
VSEFTWWYKRASERVRHLDDGTTMRGFTVFFRELKMLRGARYIQLMLPDGRVIMVPGSKARWLA